MNKSKLLEISNIKDLKKILILNLMGTKDIYDVAAIVVFYENGCKSLIYSELDEEYFYFFSTIRRVYIEEKDRRNIEIDELSKKLLEENEPKIELDKLKKEIGTIGGNKKINYNKLQVEMYYNILKYLLEELFVFFNRNIDIKCLLGMSKHFRFTYVENKLEHYMPFTYKEEDSTKVKFIFPGIFNNNRELYINLEFNEVLTATICDREGKLVIKYEVSITEKFGKITKYVFLNGVLDSKVIIDLDSSKECTIYDKKIDGIVYYLPWNDLRSIKIDLTGEEVKSNIIKYTDYFKYGTNVQIREKIIQNVIKKGLFTKDKEVYKIKGDISLRIDDELIITNFYKVDHYVIKEVTFIGNHLTRGIFKSELEGKTFYKIYNLVDDNLLEELLTQVKESVKGYELMNERELKKLLKRSIDNNEFI